MAGSFAVITGASSGIGLELARQLADRDHDVLICANDDDIQAAAAELTETTGAGAVPVQVDLSQYDQVEKLVAAVGAAGRPVDVLALNAGFGNGGRFLEIPLEREITLLNVNIVAVVHLAKRLLPEMVARGTGRVLITSSVAATMPGPYYATYAASKAFDQSFAEALRYELEDTGITVTALMPGPTDTRFFDRAGMAGTRADEGHKDHPADVAAQAVDALLDGKDHVIAGSKKNNVQVAVGALMPETAKAAVHARLTEPPESN